MRSSVDLPAPLGPSTVRNSPGPTLKSAPDQMIFPPYPEASPEASITAPAPARPGGPAGGTGWVVPLMVSPPSRAWRSAASSPPNHRSKLAPGAGSSR